MKTTIRIAKAELQVLFFSPVAWLILVIFAIQTGIVYANIYDMWAHRDILGQSTNNLTSTIFNNTLRGFFVNIQGYLYLYIPLLTMGVISREFSSGSIKLLYSSPVNSYQIVFGKYLALLVFALTMIGILGMYSLHGMITIENVDYPAILSALLGLFLLICAYAAVGLFMSSVTSYTVVAAMGTLAILALLNMMRGWWQDVEFVRDITYWIAISGRSNTFIRGLITSEDFLYFIMVVCMFVSFTIIKLQVERKKTTFLATSMKYVAVVFVTVMIGYFSALPKFKSYYDATYSKVNTLTESSQKVMEKLDGPLTIHTYVNMLEANFNFGLPASYKGEMLRFEKYLRFKPDIKIKQHHYYHRALYPYLDERFPELTDKERIDTLKRLNKWKFPIKSYDEVNEHVDLSDESYRYVHLLERGNGERTFLRIYNDIIRHPNESEITAAFKRLVMDLPLVGFVTGHGERQSDSKQDRGYNMIAEEKTFRHAFINQGFDFMNLTLEQPVPQDIRILMIAEPRQEFTDIELQHLHEYIERGGNLILAGEPGNVEIMNRIAQPIGVTFSEGTLVHQFEELQPDLMALNPTEEGKAYFYHLETMARQRYMLSMPGATALTFDPSSGFESTTLFRTQEAGVWNELNTTNFIDEVPEVNPELGETEQAFSTVLALSRQVGDKQQKILVTGDADWLSNGELGTQRSGFRASNYSLISGAFYWLSDGEVPIDMRLEPSIDNKMFYSNLWGFFKGFFKWGMAVSLALVGVLIWIRRRGR